jgi:hypothetical protein
MRIIDIIGQCLEWRFGEIVKISVLIVRISWYFKVIIANDVVQDYNR